MTVFDLEEKGRWFDLDDGGRLRLRLMTTEKLKEIRKATIKKKTIFKKVEGTPAKFDEEEINAELSDEMFWDFIIVDWENFFDRNGNPIECTKENKMLLIAKSPKFAEIVQDCRKELEDAEIEEREQETKNLPSGPSSET